MIAQQQTQPQAIPLRRPEMVAPDDAIVSEVQPLAVSTRTAAAMLAISERSLFDLTAPRGPIRAVRKERRLLYSVAELRRWLEHETERVSTDAARA